MIELTEIDWIEEAEHINMYAEWEIKPTKEGVFEYIEIITSINGEEYLFENERKIMEAIMNDEQGIENV